MYKVNFEKNCRIIDWDVVCFGIETGLFEPKYAIDYINALIKYDLLEENSVAIELLTLKNHSYFEIMPLVKKLKETEGEVEEITARLLRYVILDYMKDNIKEPEELLDAVNDVYMDFDFPEDMVSFVMYLPEDISEYNPLEHSHKDNLKRMTQLFYDYMEKEEELLGIEYI